MKGTPYIHVTDHAVLRYIERVKGFDVEAVRAHISKICTGIDLATCVKAEGHEFMIKNHVVVTVKPAGAPNQRRVPRRKDDLEYEAVFGNGAVHE